MCPLMSREKLNSLGEKASTNKIQKFLQNKLKVHAFQYCELYLSFSVICTRLFKYATCVNFVFIRWLQKPWEIEFLTPYFSSFELWNDLNPYLVPYRMSTGTSPKDFESIWYVFWAEIDFCCDIIYRDCSTYDHFRCSFGRPDSSSFLGRIGGVRLSCLYFSEKQKY